MIFKNIKKIRELKNLTREYVADEIEMSTSGYGKIERGEVDLTFSKLNKIAIVFQVSIDFIINFDANKLFSELKNEF